MRPAAGRAKSTRRKISAPDDGCQPCRLRGPDPVPIRPPGRTHQHPGTNAYQCGASAALVLDGDIVAALG
jgi:hypothetical protein